MKGRSAGNRQKRFRDVASDGIKPRPLAGGQNNGFHLRGYLERCAKDGATIMRITIGWLFAAMLLIGGCGGDVRAKVSVPTATSIPVGNAGFESYKQAAEEVEQKAAKYIGRTAWSPDQRDYIVQASSGAIRRLSGVEGALFGKTWEEPFGVREYTRGWRTIGRAIAWRIEMAVKAGNYADARFCLATAIRMANALGTSDSHDAYMGAEIVDECLAAVWPELPRFESSILSGISSDVRRLLEQGAAPEAIAEQERTLMLAQLDWVRQRYQERDFAVISDTLGQAVEPAVKYLRGLAEMEPKEQQAYFTGFASEIEAEVELFSTNLKTAPNRWESEREKGTRAWMRFTQAFGTPWKVYVERRAEVRTRLRLLAIDSALLAAFKTSGSVPKNLGGFPRALRSDPYSGSDFVFVSRGVDYKLYSVGPDGTDDGGDTGDIGLRR